MSYLQSALGQGERVVYEARRHWIDYVNGMMIVAIGIILIVLDPPGGGSGLFFIGLIIIGAGGVGLVYAWLNSITTVLAVTNRKLVAKQGLLSNFSIEQQLGKVDAITIDRSLLGRLLDYGTVTVTGSGFSATAFKHIAAPYEFRSKVQHAMHHDS